MISARFLRHRVGLAFILLSSCALAGCVSTTAATPSVEATGAPVGAGINVAPGSKEDFIVNVGRRLYFKENSSELSDEAKATLDKQAEWLQRYAQYSVKLEGFADERGTAEFNKTLGKRRAEAARVYLASIGISPERMRVKTFGNEELVEKCDDISCWSQNRRVVTVLEVRT